jgi:hypothetical protein
MEFTDPSALSPLAASNALTEAEDNYRDANARARMADPDLDGLELGEDGSDYDDLDAELVAIADLTTLIEVPKRPGYAIRCRTDYTGLDVDLIRKKCRDKKFTDGIDGIKYASLLLASMTTAIVRNGKDLELDGVSPVTFTSKPLQERMGTATADATVRKFYGLEGHVDAAGRRLMNEAGYGDEVYAGDPTQ